MDHPNLLMFHFSTPAGVGGPVPFFYEGDWHLFYRGGRGDGEASYCGHAVSRDWVRWQGLPGAVVAGREMDRDGVWVGSVIAAEGGFYLFYTAVADGGAQRQVQALATSEDLVTWTKYAGNPVIFGRPGGVGPSFRHPQVWREGGEYRMVVGSERAGGLGGLALLYRSADLVRWEYRGVLAEGVGGESGAESGAVFESPDFFELEGRGVLLTSGSRVFGHVGSYAGERLTVETVRAVDAEVFCFAKTSVDESGRRVMVGWIRDAVADSETGVAHSGRGVTHPGAGVKLPGAGVLSLPRELYLTPTGHLGQRPARELQALRGPHRAVTAFRSEGTTLIENLHLDAFELRIVIDLCSAIFAGVYVRATADGTAEGTADGSEQTLTRYSRIDRTLDRTACEADPTCPIELRVFVDRTVIETFCAGATSTQRCYPANPSAAVRVAVTSDAEIEVLELEWWEVATDLRRRV